MAGRRGLASHRAGSQELHERIEWCCCATHATYAIATMIIRAVEPSDLPALRDLFLQSRRAAFFWEPSSSFALGDRNSDRKQPTSSRGAVGSSAAGSPGG
jgi:hypothetical protein